MSNPKLSFHLICQDEEGVIGQHIRFLLKLASAVEYPVEFVIADGGSQDRTMEIINELKDDRFRVFENPWPGFIEQRNLVKSKSRGEWMFMIDADVVVSDSIYGMINGLLNAGDDVAAYFFPKIHLAYDVRYMRVKGPDPMMALFRNLPEITWMGKDLEKPCYGDVPILQHPRHFNFPWQRYVPEVVMVHFVELKSVETIIRKAVKLSKLKQSNWHGKSEDLIRTLIENAQCRIDPETGKVVHKDYEVCPVPSEITFYTEFKERSFEK